MWQNIILNGNHSIIVNGKKVFGVPTCNSITINLKKIHLCLTHQYENFFQGCINENTVIHFMMVIFGEVILIKSSDKHEFFTFLLFYFSVCWLLSHTVFSQRQVWDWQCRWLDLLEHNDPVISASDWWRVLTVITWTQQLILSVHTLLHCQ